MDEWYVQEPLQHKVKGTSVNPLFEQMNYKGKTVTSLDDTWELDAAADDNEAYSIEQETNE